jgi:hypothetical protein
MRLHSILLTFTLSLFVGSTGAAEPKYENNFEKAQLDSVPEDLMVLDGQFTVKEESGNKFLELPGAPLEAFSVLFGPNLKESASVSARIFGTATGRKLPAFDIGLFGVGGYKLRVSASKRLLELYRGDAVKTSVPLKWEPGKWTRLKLQIVKEGDKAWKIEGKAWPDGGQEPTAPTLTFNETEAPPSGRASIGGMPYSGTPIRFDDLLVAEIGR